MVAIELIGGLGNQLFQYAAARSIAVRYGHDLILDISALKSYKKHRHSDIFSLNINDYAIKSNQAFKFSFKIFSYLAGVFNLEKFKFYKQRGMELTEIYIAPKGNIYLSGYFQSEKYFFNIRSLLLNQFAPKKIDDHNKSVSEEIFLSNSLMIHVRRGDYQNDPAALINHGVMTREYYNKSMSYMTQNCLIDVCYVFSDDIKWARENIKTRYPTVYVDWNRQKPELDLFLMSKCKYHIIANSTFSWWAAWLCERDGQIVISPKNWFANSNLDSANIIPDKWIKM